MQPFRLAAPVVGLAIVLAACSSGGSPATSAPTTPAAAASSSDAGSGYGRGGSSPAAAASVALAATTLGQVLTGDKGMTLYAFTPDSATTSACTGSCATNWPPLAGAAPTLGAGLQAGDFSTVTRDDGTSQIAFRGHPLYYFKGDTAAGDTKGQGVGGKWFVVGADGSLIGQNAGSAAPSASAAAAGGPSIALASVSLGKVLTGEGGRTLYIFTPDSAGKSACNGDCAASWPPLAAAAAPTLGAGLDAGDFTTIARDDGSKQVAFYGMPLYYFAGDSAAGDTKGQGLGGKWYVVGADGKPIK